MLKTLNETKTLPKKDHINPMRQSLTTIGHGESRTTTTIEELVLDQAALGRSYGKPGIRAFIQSPTVVLSALAEQCAVFYMDMTRVSST